MPFKKGHQVLHPAEIDIGFRSAPYPGISPEVILDILINHILQIIAGPSKGAPNYICADSFIIGGIAPAEIPVPVNGFVKNFLAGKKDQVFQIIKAVAVFV
jgi:hypothetical protein